MSDSSRLRARLGALLADHSEDASVLERLCTGAVSLLPVDGAAIWVTTGAVDRGFSGASDAATAELDDLQFTLGEGPCWDAARDGGPVLVGDVCGAAGERWPTFAAAATAAGVRAVFAFPVQVGAIRLGVVVLVGARPGLLGGRGVADALTVADVVALTLIDTAAHDPPGATGRPRPPEGPDLSWLRRSEVHQATGMVMAQLGVGAQEALARLRAHAFAQGRATDEVAREIVGRRLRLDDDQRR